MRCLTQTLRQRILDFGFSQKQRRNEDKSYDQ